MSLKIAQQLAWRYIRGSDRNKSIDKVTKICFLGIFISTLCLTVEIFVMNGFEKAITEKMQSIYPHITLDAPVDSSFEFEKMKKKLFKKYPEKIVAIAPAHSKQIIIQTADSENPAAVYFRAINAVNEAQVSTLEKKLTHTHSLKYALNNQQIIIGKTLAKNLDVTVGDTCTLLFSYSDELSTKESSFESIKVVIGDIMNTGIVQYDKYLIFGSHELMKELTGQELVTQIGIKLSEGCDDVTFMKELEIAFNVEANSWKTLYPALVSASKLEKYVMFFLLALITLIASTNLISLLFMQITHKRTDIALLKTLGMNDRHIMAIFMYMGLFITTAASAIGLITAFLVGSFLQKYPFITLPDVYYVTHLPISMEWSTFISVFGIIIILSFFSTLFSARTAQNINITNTLRFDS